MNINPALFQESRFLNLCERVGELPAFLSLLSLWSYCETKNTHTLDVTDYSLAKICNYNGDPSDIVAALTGGKYVYAIPYGGYYVYSWEDELSE